MKQANLQMMEKIHIHMPAKQASPLPEGDGPAIQMDPQDHKRTASNGGNKGSEQQAYRDQQKELIDQGKFDDAFLMDVDDIQKKFGNKYDDAIWEAIDAIPDHLNWGYKK